MGRKEISASGRLYECASSFTLLFFLFSLALRFLRDSHASKTPISQGIQTPRRPPKKCSGEELGEGYSELNGLRDLGVSLEN
jgi:hypothetical protein